MVRCKLCSKTRCRGGAKGQCCKKYQLCPVCAVTEHPEDYKPNFILMTMSKAGYYTSARKRNKNVVGGSDNHMKNYGKTNEFGKRIISTDYLNKQKFEEINHE